MWTSLLAERPLVLSLLLGVLACGSLWGWLQTGQRPALAVGLVAFAGIPLVWVIAAYWVTEREQIVALIHEVAANVEANDHERVLAVIGHPQLRRRAETELQNFDFSQATVQRIRRIDVIDGTFPRQADAELLVKVTVVQHGGQLGQITVPRRLMLKLEKRGDAGVPQDWVVIGYQHGPPGGGGDPFSSRSVPSVPLPATP